ncbi:hypothetical protein L7F22_062977 [Adiantum nelumboides]|nr:hypothetical protein [Adiantum nelumboides]
MTHTRSMKMAMEELFQSRQQEEPVEVECDDSESKSYQGSGETAMAVFDPNKEETQVWLKRINLYEFAYLPWDAWSENEVVEHQWNMIKESKGVIIGDVRLIPNLVSKVFKISWNRAANQFWYLEKVCNLQKTAYISNEAFAPLQQAQQCVKVDWEIVLYNRMQLTSKRDRHRTPAVGRVAPYLAAIFEHVLKVTPAALGMRTPVADTLMEEGTVSGRSEFKKSESTSKKITLFSTEIVDGFATKNVPKSLLAKEGKSASHGAMGIFFVEEATNCLTNLEKFLQSQDEALRVLENAKQEHKYIVVSKGEMQTISMQLLQEKSNKEMLQEEWVDGLNTALDEQSKELDEKVAAVTTKNVLLINRVSPLAEMEKAILKGQGMTRVLVADSNADALKKEVLEYAQEMWYRATKTWREHMAMSTDQFKNWFLCARQDSVKRENEALKIENKMLVAEMEETRNNRKEIEDILSKLKAELSSALLEPDWNLAVEAESDVEKQVDADFVAKRLWSQMQKEILGSILLDPGITGPGQHMALAIRLCQVLHPGNFGCFTLMEVGMLTFVLLAFQGVFLGKDVAH